MPFSQGGTLCSWPWTWRSGKSVAATSSSLPSAGAQQTHLAWEATPHSIHEGIMNSDCLVFVFSLLWLRRRYRIHQASTKRLRETFYPQPLGSWLRTLPMVNVIVAYIYVLILFYTCFCCIVEGANNHTFRYDYNPYDCIWQIKLELGE